MSMGTPEEYHLCPYCSSDNTQFMTECYEDEHHEMIEKYLVCNECDYDERDVR